ncbi:Gfo/Idh/MocA family protein [Pedobacter foliorum]|uniref:Gfo/Idh/MocA family protein n=1 Tax=Pedobacter foliorum TaxID=2739058 RepID=UPI00156408EC|nr:Gfo/Idh/MocA family oxidoreductase [Pedobacter foliorum]NRF41880.1 Gfo/Idh/MocA family oxidoreductase [Pedobacter foliorum]
MTVKKSNTNDASRRNFIKSASIVAGSFMIVPRHVLGKGFIAPSDKLNIAGIGVGGKGESDLSEFAKNPKVNIVGLCDVDDRQAATSRKRFPKAKYYKDFREMLDKEKNNIDACSISTPDHIHAIATISAMQLGKHVYTQKPLTHDIHEARLLATAAKRFKVITQMGNQGGSSDGVRQAMEIHNAGLLGDVHTVQVWTNRPIWPQGLPTPTGKFETPNEVNWDLWLGPAKYRDYNPAYMPWNWRGFNAFGTGALGDMACHMMDPVFRLLPIDFPTEVECSIPTSWSPDGKEAKYPEGFPAASIIHLKYPRKDNKGTIDVSWYDGGLLPKLPDELLPGEAFGASDGGALFIGTKSKMIVDCYGANPRLLPSKLMKTTTMPKQAIARVPEGHYQQWVNACLEGYGKSKTSSNFEYAGPFTESILIGNLAIRSWNIEGNAGRKRLLWDAKAMKITNFDEANQFVKLPRREGWELPNI